MTGGTGSHSAQINGVGLERVCEKSPEFLAFGMLLANSEGREACLNGVTLRI